MDMLSRTLAVSAEHGATSQVPLDALRLMQALTEVRGDANVATTEDVGLAAGSFQGLHSNATSPGHPVVQFRHGVDGSSGSGGMSDMRDVRDMRAPKRQRILSDNEQQEEELEAAGALHFNDDDEDGGFAAVEPEEAHRHTLSGINLDDMMMAAQSQHHGRQFELQSWQSTMEQTAELPSMQQMLTESSAVIDNLALQQPTMAVALGTSSHHGNFDEFAYEDEEQLQVNNAAALMMDDEDNAQEQTADAINQNTSINPTILAHDHPEHHSQPATNAPPQRRAKKSTTKRIQKAPRNAFHFFCDEQRQALRARMPNGGDVTVALGYMWKRTSEQARMVGDEEGRSCCVMFCSELTGWWSVMTAGVLR